MTMMNEFSMTVGSIPQLEIHFQFHILGKVAASEKKQPLP